MFVLFDLCYSVNFQNFDEYIEMVYFKLKMIDGDGDFVDNFKFVMTKIFFGVEICRKYQKVENKKEKKIEIYFFIQKTQKKNQFNNTKRNKNFFFG